MASPNHRGPTCQELGELLMQYRDGTLEAERAEFLSQHLHECPNCLALLGSYEDTIEVVQRLRPVKLPTGLLERLRAHLTRRAPDAGGLGAGGLGTVGYDPPLPPAGGPSLPGTA